MPLTLTLRIHIEAKSFTHREDIQKSVEASFQPKTPKYQVLLRNFPPILGFILESSLLLQNCYCDTVRVLQIAGPS